ncbi:hypothetical protein [Pseudonocardia nigra]|uniref:hypothetical protein n=1 Tax=Pseudonocardia nigra TaxID=1921578 RepID=UPI001C5E0AB9|nr:hypothetical protein [Pseudonocardia nigra]
MTGATGSVIHHERSVHVQIVYTFTRVAVTVRRWFEIGTAAEMEHGARLELALLAQQPHRGTESAAQRTVVDQTFWRADIFGRLDRPDAPYSAAHFHSRFDGVEPCGREWSGDLTANPWAWLTDQLEHLEDRLAGAGFDPGLAADDGNDLRELVPRIVASARELGPEVPLTRDEEFRLTRDAAERVRRMLDIVEDQTRIDREHIAPWLQQV